MFEFGSSLMPTGSVGPEHGVILSFNKKDVPTFLSLYICAPPGCSDPSFASETTSGLRAGVLWAVDLLKDYSAFLKFASHVFAEGGDISACARNIITNSSLTFTVGLNIGRTPSKCAIVLKDPSVSGIHLSLSVEVVVQLKDPRRLVAAIEEGNAEAVGLTAEVVDYVALWCGALDMSTNGSFYNSQKIPKKVVHPFEPPLFQNLSSDKYVTQLERTQQNVAKENHCTYDGKAAKAGIFTLGKSPGQKGPVFSFSCWIANGVKSVPGSEGTSDFRAWIINEKIFSLSPLGENEPAERVINFAGMLLTEPRDQPGSSLWRGWWSLEGTSKRPVECGSEQSDDETGSNQENIGDCYSAGKINPSKGIFKDDVVVKTELVASPVQSFAARPLEIQAQTRHLKPLGESFVSRPIISNGVSQTGDRMFARDLERADRLDRELRRQDFSRTAASKDLRTSSAENGRSTLSQITEDNKIELASLREMMDDAKTDLEIMKTRNSSLSKQLQDVIKDRDELRSENHRLTTEYDEMNLRRKQATEQVRGLKLTVRENEDKNKELKKSLEEERQTLRRQLHEVQTERVLLREEVDKLEQKHAEETTAQKLELENVTEALEALRTESSRTETALVDKLKACEKHINSLSERQEHLLALVSSAKEEAAAATDASRRWFSETKPIVEELAVRMDSFRRQIVSARTGEFDKGVQMLRGNAFSSCTQWKTSSGESDSLGLDRVYAWRPGSDHLRFLDKHEYETNTSHATCGTDEEDARTEEDGGNMTDPDSCDEGSAQSKTPKQQKNGAPAKSVNAAIKPMKRGAVKTGLFNCQGLPAVPEGNDSSDEPATEKRKRSRDEAFSDKDVPEMKMAKVG